MGLDISYYQKVEYVRPHNEDHEYDYNTQTSIYVNKDFAERADGLKTGVYNVTGEQDGFRAGSYGGYNAWRRQLAAMVGVTPEQIWEGEVQPEQVPFYELINFSDCEGVIGPKTSLKLAKDFIQYESKVEPFVHTLEDWYEREHFVARYADWKRAFETAAGEGAVCFH
ncbi:MAG: hypothetical protein JSS66_06755 [Armatimonadetes bacterium]|nr:hypothetical protein [Armatimonadota bacterium]